MMDVIAGIIQPNQLAESSLQDKRAETFKDFLRLKIYTKSVYFKIIRFYCQACVSVLGI